MKTNSQPIHHQPLKPCKHPGCRNLSADGYCEEHKAEGKRKNWAKDDEKRGSSNERGYNWNWRKVRNNKLSIDPLCERCKKKGRVVVARLVHHKDRDSSNNDDTNLESLCVPCHEDEHKEERKGRRW